MTTSPLIAAVAQDADYLAETADNGTVTVEVWHNVAPWDAKFYGWHPSHQMERVFAYAIEPAMHGAIAEMAFEMFNVGEGSIARQYRALGLRSLSVGDVLKIDGTRWVCMPHGFREVRDAATLARTRELTDPDAFKPRSGFRPYSGTWQDPSKVTD